MQNDPWILWEPAPQGQLKSNIGRVDSFDAKIQGVIYQHPRPDDLYGLTTPSPKK